MMDPFKFAPVAACSFLASLFIATAGPTDDGGPANAAKTTLPLEGNASPDVVTWLPVILLTPEIGPVDLQSMPLSVTAVTATTIEDADVRLVKNASVYAPNVFINESTARSLSTPFFRGIGGSPNNPGVTTFVDGVPQLNASSSNLELVDVDQIDFVRGPQGALYGRNTLGGLINITSTPPSLRGWTGGLETNFGSHDFRDVRFTLSGPIVKDEAGFAFAGGYSTRDGYTKGNVTGNDVDNREAFFGKVQLQLKATGNFDARLLVTYEHDGDGGYALGDLAQIRRTPHRINLDFAGFTHRDVVAPTLILNYYSDLLKVTSITGGVWWKTTDSTDLDLTALPLATRWNQEEASQFTQEIRFSSLADAPLELCNDLALGWTSGVFFFTQNYDQTAHDDFSPLFGAMLTGFPFSFGEQTQSTLTDWGTGIYGQGKLTAWNQLDFIAGLRYDYENKGADLLSFATPGLPPPTPPHFSDDFSTVSPQFSLAWRITPDKMLYGTITRGFKAGGFNEAAPVGSESFGLETSWNYEVGFKSEWLGGKLRANAALFYIAWDDLQLNVPLQAVPGRFFIDNTGSANSKGAELELNYQPIEGWDLFGSAGCADVRFDGGSMSEGMNVGGNRLPYAPEYTANAGTQFAWDLNPTYTLYTRAQVTVYGNFKYDASNREGQGTYSIADFRVGIRTRRWFTEGWIDNAFNTNYVPVAFEYSTTFAPSGYVGESGAPVAVGIRAGVNF